MRGLIENNFSSFEEGFGQNGLKNFSTLLGPGNYGYEDFDNVENDSYMWAYGCGGGTFTSAGGISTSANLAADSVQAVFTMLFGSYFGDWDSQNNFLRSALGSGTILSCTWSARPNWQYHPMGMGFNLGYCALLSQNNPGFIYSPGFGNRQIHVGLMGDPGLRMHIVAPPGPINIIESVGNATLNWVSSPDAVLGYYIYRKTSDIESYQLLNTEYIESTSFIDSCLELNKTYDYLVRAVELVESPSGSFFALSVGSKASQLITTNSLPMANFNVNVDLNMIEISNTSENADNYFWDLGENGVSTEENPGIFSNIDAGEYSITLIAENKCGTDTLIQNFIISSLQEFPLAQAKIFPNPADQLLSITFENLISSYQLTIYNQNGKMQDFIKGENTRYVEISTADLPNGFYILQGILDGKVIHVTFQIIH
jgi:PKD repeat protein